MKSLDEAVVEAGDAAGGAGGRASDEVLAVLRRFWGFEGLRPLQLEAIQAELERRDSLVVMPTGGGKSLCYQVPPAVAGRTDVVVSPLIALMKDQVDALRESGYPAAAIHSGIDLAEIRQVEREIANGRHHLIFVAPERLLTPRFLELAARLNVSSFAIDEAHCISQWGHDFRPEYRKLAELKTRFPSASIHAYTATATERVRGDIIEQLGLRDPAVLVGSFDRANLLYRVRPKLDVNAQIGETIRLHKGEASIVYSISRNDTERIAAYLASEGVRAAAYHAGMEADERRSTQDRFAAEEIDVVVATVAFGMGIDRSDVRCVIHAAIPKSIEAYQQETGRAGRDGLPAECVLFYSAADVIRWQNLMERSAEEKAAPPEVVESGNHLLEEMRRFATVVRCRHAALSAYFGEIYQGANCGACDFCLGEVEGVADSTVLAQKVLSCVARVEQRFGVEHVVDVLSGASSERVRRLGHEKLSTYGILKDVPRKTLTNLVYQLVDAGLLERTPGDRPTLKLNTMSWEVMRGGRAVTLLQAKESKSKRTRMEEASWRDVDEALFESLRKLRREIAAERGMPAYVILHDATLRELASVRPTTLEALRYIRGIGEKKRIDFGERVIECIRSH
ncbi:MAG TPA: DNA helicase RecQ [Candidatus Binatus sp.]|uniref:DNA helicase RecQ n=1 Tax=Candidatus Binatus sp. TaxID=2811406 RepID=UPI002B492978|nr:DNA helicase RecQ [Candidatus Binatus sp.]HKN12060.1 DNA helicase RecQ [Candidatus Binatus sp.]